MTDGPHQMTIGFGICPENDAIRHGGDFFGFLILVAERSVERKKSCRSPAPIGGSAGRGKGSVAEIGGVLFAGAPIGLGRSLASPAISPVAGDRLIVRTQQRTRQG